MYLHHTPAVQRLFYPNCIWNGPDHERTLYLTFDDGPDEESTEYVLSQLEKYQAKATFFLVGRNVEQFPEKVPMILGRNHRIGNHTYSHSSGWRVSQSEYLEEVEKCERVFRNSSFTSNLFRPPYGRPNFSAFKSLRKRYSIVMWSHLSGDFDQKLDTGRALKRLKTAEPGSILLFHTSPKAFGNLKILLPETLDYFSQLGYSFKKL